MYRFNPHLPTIMANQPPRLHENKQVEQNDREEEIVIPTGAMPVDQLWHLSREVVERALARRRNGQEVDKNELWQSKITIEAALMYVIRSPMRKRRRVVEDNVGEPAPEEAEVEDYQPASPSYSPIVPENAKEFDEVFPPKVLKRSTSR